MELKKEFFQEADKAIAEFDSIYDFFKVAKSHNAYQDGARYEKYKKQNRMPSSLLYECMKESLDKVGPGRSSEDLVEQFYRDNHNYKRNEERKRERRLKRKLEALDLILKMEGWD